MTTGANFEISINDTPRTHRDDKAIAIEAALYHKERHPSEDVKVRDLRDESVINIGWKVGKAFVLQ
jgi:hypothetical protein